MTNKEHLIFLTGYEEIVRKIIEIVERESLDGTRYIVRENETYLNEFKNKEDAKQWARERVEQKTKN